MHSISSLDIPSLLIFAQELAITAGEHLRISALARIVPGAERLETLEKQSAVDLVTKIDEETEGIIRDAIRARYPDHK